MSPSEAALLRIGDVIMRDGIKGIVRDFAKDGIKVQWGSDAGEAQVLRYPEMSSVDRSAGWV